MRHFSKLLAVVMSVAMLVTAFAIYPASVTNVSAVDHEHYKVGEWTRTETTHTYTYPCCGEKAIDNYPHMWDENNVCVDCGYGCTHEFEGGCNEDSVCKYCGFASGEMGTGHTGKLVYSSNEDTHTAYYDCREEVVVADEAHKFYNEVCIYCKYTCEHDLDEDGVCPNCGYACDHEGGEATCEEGATCTKCGNIYTDVDDTNHTCEIVWVTTRTKHYSVYSCNEEKVTLSEKHYGGVATCVDFAVCEVCGAEYGEIDPANHAEETEWTQTATEHTLAYTCCGEVVVATEVHEWEDGVCTECKYGCEHTGGVATCLNKKVCEICGSKYGEIDPENHEGEAKFIITETTHRKAYECCDADVIAEEAHKGGEATCTEKAVCEVCEAEYGDLKPHNYTEATCTKKATCTECGAETGELKPHNYTEATCTKKATCTECGAETGELKPHDYTEATCTAKAKCKVCGAETGDLKAHDYTEATCTAKAKCKACGAETGDLKAHNYANGACTACGANDPNFKPAPDTSDRTTSIALMIAGIALLGYAIVPSKKRHTA